MERLYILVYTTGNYAGSILRSAFMNKATVDRLNKDLGPDKQWLVT